MDDTKLQKDQPIPSNDSAKHLQFMPLPKISLPNQHGNLLQLNRSDTFRLVIYFYSLTGHPEKNCLKIGIKSLVPKDALLKTVSLETTMKIL